MVDIYTQPELYDAIHNKYEWDKNLLISTAKIADGPVLELAAGTGRLTQLIIDLGYEYTGIDTSQEFLSIARKKYNTYNHKVQFLHGDMRDFKLAKKFNFVFIGFNSFLHLLTNEDAMKCLQSVYDHLTIDGIFLLSVFTPDPNVLYRDKNQYFPATGFFQYNGSKCRIMETNHYDQYTQVNRITWRLEQNTKLRREKYNFSMKMYYPHEMDILLGESGLLIKEKIGNYDGSPMNEESGFQIYVCARA